MKKIQLTIKALLLTSILFVSCSKDTEIEIPLPGNEFVEIPDIEFEKELIRVGIDSDGIINQKILKTMLKKLQNYHSIILI